MIPSNTIPEVCNYANSETALKEMPSPEQISAGVMPLDSLPAAWWNCMWNDTNKAVNCTRYTIESVVTEVNNVLSRTGICVCEACTNQLLEAIECIRQTIGQAYTAGAVKSSTDTDKITIANDGTMSVNCFGNVASLTTSSHVIVSAINELKANYDTCLSAVPSTLNTINLTKVQNAHASATTSYGVGSAADYGHLKISDTYDTDLSMTGMVASQKAVSDVFNYFLSTTGGIKECAKCTCPSKIYPKSSADDPDNPDMYLATVANSGYVLTCLSCAYIDTYGNLKGAWIEGGCNRYTGGFQSVCYCYQGGFCSNVYVQGVPNYIVAPNIETIQYDNYGCRCCGCWRNHLFEKSPVPTFPGSLNPSACSNNCRYAYGVNTLWGSPSKCWDTIVSGDGGMFKRSGTMIYSFWKQITLGPSGQAYGQCVLCPSDFQVKASDWCINGYPFYDNLPYMGGCDYCDSCEDGWQYRTCTSWQIVRCPRYDPTGEHKYQPYHINFHIYMNPIYDLSIPPSCGCWCHPNSAVYLGVTTTLDNSSNCKGAITQTANCCDTVNLFRGCCCMYGYRRYSSGYNMYCGGGPNYGFHMYMANGCHSYSTWLCCFRSWANWCCAAYDYYISGMCCAITYGSKYASANTCYYSRFSDPPIYNFYIES